MLHCHPREIVTQLRFVRATLKGDNGTLNPCYTQIFPTTDMQNILNAHQYSIQQNVRL